MKPHLLSIDTVQWVGGKTAWQNSLHCWYLDTNWVIKETWNFWLICLERHMLPLNSQFSKATFFVSKFRAENERRENM